MAGDDPVLGERERDGQVGVPGSGGGRRPHPKETSRVSSDRRPVTVGFARGVLVKHVDVAPLGAQEYVCVATFLPVRRWRDVIPFLWASRRVEAQLRSARGLVRYGLRAEVFRRRFWTVSVWRDHEAVDNFVRTDPHWRAVEQFARWADEGAAFVRWHSPVAVLSWDEALARLRTPTFVFAARETAERRRGP